MAFRKRIRTLDDLLLAAQNLKRARVVAVALAEDKAALAAVFEIFRKGIGTPLLIGDETKIKRIARTIRAPIRSAEIIHEPDPVTASRLSVELCRDGKADVLMKGHVSTDVILRAVLDRETGIAIPGRILSHAAVFEPTGFNRLMILSDAGVNIAPDVGRKAEIVKNAVGLAERLGVAKPKVAILAAVEKIRYPEMPATTDAAILKQMSENGSFNNAIVAGPLSLDLAISAHSVKCKNLSGPVPGKADILITPDIEAGNILYKALVHFAGFEIATAVLGVKVPCVVPSRADSGLSKLYSIALAALLVDD